MLCFIRKKENKLVYVYTNLAALTTLAKHNNHKKGKQTTHLAVKITHLAVLTSLPILRLILLDRLLRQFHGLRVGLPPLRRGGLNVFLRGLDRTLFRASLLTTTKEQDENEEREHEQQQEQQLTTRRRTQNNKNSN